MAGEWKKDRESFEKIDVRKMTGNFLPMLLEKAGKVPAGEGIRVIQSFEPIPLYSALEAMGFEYATEKAPDGAYHVFFYRREEVEAKLPGGADAPLKPTAILNFKRIDDSLADLTVRFWELVWGGRDPALGQKTKLLLSLANAVGAGRFRQAVRELVKAYSIGCSVAEMDELFTLFAWNQGIGHFASEIGPSPLFGAYQLIKRLEGKGTTREEIMKRLMEEFGEKNPAVGTAHRKKD